MQKSVDVCLLSDEVLIGKTYGRKILNLVFKDFPDLAPEYACFYEPINKPIPTVDEALKYWTDDFDVHHLIARRRSTVKGDFSIGRDKDRKSWISLSYSWNKKIEWSPFFKVLQKSVNGYFGFVHLLTVQEQKSGHICHCPPSFDLKEKGIPDLGWGTFFGKRFLDRFPLEALKKEGFSVKRQGNGYFLTLTEDISTLLKDYDGFQARRLHAKSLFPEGVFQKRD